MNGQDWIFIRIHYKNNGTTTIPNGPWIKEAVPIIRGAF